MCTGENGWEENSLEQQCKHNDIYTIAHLALNEVSNRQHEYQTTR